MKNEMYFKLFNSITDALKKINEAEEILKNAQVEAEEMYVANED